MLAKYFNQSFYICSGMKYYIIAGEASGDLHGSNLIREIRKLDPDAKIRCWGGDLMQEAWRRLQRGRSQALLSLTAGFSSRAMDAGELQAAIRRASW
jgi:hypothetical protein